MPPSTPTLICELERSVWGKLHPRAAITGDTKASDEKAGSRNPGRGVREAGRIRQGGEGGLSRMGLRGRSSVRRCGG